MENKEIKSLTDFCKKIDEWNANVQNRVLFYRGHASKTWELVPAIYRGKPNLVDSEDKMIDETIRLFPNEFTNSMSTMEQLVKMQHYELPTRLLDLTSNPLVALYFACQIDENHKDDAGQVFMFPVLEEEIKGVESDSVSVVSNIAKQKAGFSIDKDTKHNIDVTSFNSEGDMPYLIHTIQREKPHFQSIIEPETIESVIPVQTKMNNPRIIRQSGAFFLFGIKDNKKELAELKFKRGSVLIDSCCKQKILKELEQIGISKRTLFPEMEIVLPLIAEKYKSKS